jgi:putative transposase
MASAALPSGPGACTKPRDAMGTRQAIIKDAVPIEMWPTVLDAELDDERRAQYQARAEAMRLYFAWVPVEEIERRTGQGQTGLPRLARRCLKVADDGRVQGFRACIPFIRMETYARTAQLLPNSPGARPGLSGALNTILKRFPDIEKLIVQYVRNEAKRIAVPEHKLRPCDLHRIFLRCLEAKGVGQDEWPFTTKYLGLRSIQQFMKNVLDQNFARSTMAREDSPARAHLSVGKGLPSLLSFDEPYDAVEIDAYKIEAHLTAAFHTPEGLETDLRLDRLNLIAVVDRFSGAVLAYSVVYRPEVNADDILKVIRDAASGTWRPMDLTIADLHYPNGGGLPSGVIEQAQGALWSATLFDGALAHLSTAVHARARAALGFAINWGPVAHFERRPNVERTFNQIARTLFKRLPSTTGVNPHSGRADEAERKAVVHHIRAAEVEQLLDVAFAQHNATPNEGMSYLTPLEVIRYFVDQPDRFEFRKRPADTAADAGFKQHESAVVRGNRSTGRRPYVQIDRVHYTNEVLATSAHLIGARLLLEVDEDDMRQVKAFLPNGAELGMLKAHGKWGVTTHSRRTRRAINSLITKRLITVTTFDDPMQAYMRHLAAYRDKRGKTGPGPKQATEIVRIKKEVGVDAHSIEGARVTEPIMPTNRVDAPLRGRLLSDPPLQFFAKVKNRR